MGSEFRNAVYSQSENLRAAREAFVEAVPEIDLGALRRGTIVFSGIGASAHALTPTVLALRAAEQRAFAISPGELRSARAAALGDAFVLVSQSGASAEIVEALAHLDGAPVVAISAHAESPLVEAADAWLPLGPLEDTRVATLSYTATLQALGMLCDALLGTSSGWQDLPELASEVLEDTEAVVQRLAENFATVVAVDAVGGGAARASAGETALLAREGLRVPAVGMETREYLHGPLEAVNDGFGCILFGRERELELAAELASFGATVTLISDRSAAATPSSVHAIEVPRVGDLVAPILEILPAQLLIDDVAHLRGIEIGMLRREQADTKVVTG
jgi:glucosamine--fructose-6-phosphate aminotransferase (isomerizing)